MPLRKLAAGGIGLILIAGCGAPSSTRSTEPESTRNSSTTDASSPISATVAPPSSFSGPIAWTCRDAGTTHIRKLNPQTGQIIEIGTIDQCRARGMPGPGMIGLPFGGQRSLQQFSPDLSKEAVVVSGASQHVGYKELKTDKIVDVTALLAQPDEFDTTGPRHQMPMFAPDGSFVFHDWETNVWNFVDLASNRVTKTQAEWPSQPGQPGQPAITSGGEGAFIGPRGEVERGTGSTLLGYAVCGDKIWWMDDRRYLATIVTEDGSSEALTIADIGPQGFETSNSSCGVPVSPNTSIRGALSDPEGSVYFLGGNENAFYEANPADPSKPRRIPMDGDLDLGYGFNFVAWQ